MSSMAHCKISTAGASNQSLKQICTAYRGSDTGGDVVASLVQYAGGDKAVTCLIDQPGEALKRFVIPLDDDTRYGSACYPQAVSDPLKMLPPGGCAVPSGGAPGSTQGGSTQGGTGALVLEAEGALENFRAARKDSTRAADGASGRALYVLGGSGGVRKGDTFAARANRSEAAQDGDSGGFPTKCFQGEAVSFKR